MNLCEIEMSMAILMCYSRILFFEETGFFQKGINFKLICTWLTGKDLLCHKKNLSVKYREYHLPTSYTFFCLLNFARMLKKECVLKLSALYHINCIKCLWCCFYGRGGVIF